MFSKTLYIFFIVNFVSGSYGQKDKKFFRKDYTYIEAAQGFFKKNPFFNSWYGAKRVCALEGAIFWHAKDENEFKAVIPLWNDTYTGTDLWTGLSDILVEGRFVTVDGKPSSEVYIDWYEHGTSPPEKDCVWINHDGKMDEGVCTTESVFICKKSLESLEWNNDCNMPNLDYIFSQNTGKCYKLHTTPKKWADASDLCQIELTNLAVITNKQEADFLANLTLYTPTPRIKESYQRGMYHLGFHNLLKEGWQTVLGTPFNVEVEMWFDNYQPEGDEECGAMFFNGRLINTDCEMKSFFICEHVVENAVAPNSDSLNNFQPYVGGGVE